MYASGITFTGVTAVSSGGGGTVTAADNGTSLSGTTVVLGQDPGQAGSPGRLISNREIPLNTFLLNLRTKAGATLSFAPGGIAILFNPTTTGQQFAELETIQGVLPHPSTFGNFQIGWLEQNFTNPDGQIDAVMSTGYNTDGANGKNNPGEASFATVLESHFQQAGIGNGTFEWYLTSDTIAGQIGRHMFMVVDKITGAATMTWTLDNLTIANTVVAGALVYCSLNNQGLSMTCTPSFTLQMATTTPALDGAFKIESQTGSGGKTRFIDESGVATGFFQFDAAAVFQSSNFANGFANYWFLSTAAAGATRGFIFQNLNFNAGDSILTVWNNGNVSFIQNSKFGINSPTPTAKVDIAAGTAAAGTAPLKFAIGVNLTAPEAGAIEYDGTNFFATNNIPTRYILAKTLTATASLDFPNTAAGTSADLTIAVVGAADGDAVTLGVPIAAQNANSCYTAFISAADTVTVRFNNYQLLTAIDPASGTFRVSVLKY